MKDLTAIAALKQSSIPWMWAQEGFVRTHGDSADAGYVAHHNAPQYFDYIRNNKAYWSQVNTTQALMKQITTGTLPESGVFFVKGSKANHFGWKPASKNPLIQADYIGDDDHPGPGDADVQISEAFVATWVDAIASSKYWKDSAILIAWDDGGGFYDHVAPTAFEQCNDGFPCGDGQRLPFIVVSPYSLSGTVVHDYSDTVSVSKFVEGVFGVPAMASLPDEASVEPYGPRDYPSKELSDLAGAFDLAKLNGSTGLNPASLAEIPGTVVNHFPSTMNCQTLHLRPLNIPTQPPYYRPHELLKGSLRIESLHSQSD